MEARERARSVAPDFASVLKEAGKGASVKVERNGEWAVTTRDARVAKRLRAMMRESNKVKSERGEEVSAGRTRETLVARDGTRHAVSQHLVDTIKHKGFKPVIHWGKPNVRGRALPDGGYEESRKQPDGSWEVRRWTKEQLAAQSTRPLW